MKSSIEVGKALKIMARRLKKLNIEMKDTPCKHICTTCKYRMTETYKVIHLYTVKENNKIV